MKQIEIEFRIIERKFENGIVYFIPERTVESKRMFENYCWVNINDPDYIYCTTYDGALTLIKSFIRTHEELTADKIHELPELILKYEVNEKSLKAEAYRRGFVKGTVFLSNGFKEHITIENLNNVIYDARHNILFYHISLIDESPMYYNGYPIYNDACNSGRWAEIVSKETLLTGDIGELPTNLKFIVDGKLVDKL